MPLILTGTGSEVYTRVLANHLRDLGHIVTIDEIAHTFQYMPWLAPARPPKDANVILANSWNAAAFTYNEIPTVSVCHLVVHDPKLDAFKGIAQTAFHRTFVKPMEKAAVRKAALNIAVSSTVAKQMKSILGANHVETISNGIDTDFFCPLADADMSDQNRSDGPDKPFRLLFVGKPSLRKGFDIIDKIVVRLGDAVEFTCVGEKPVHGLPNPKGRYTGVLDRHGVRNAYRQSDLLLFPSRMEGFGLAAAEAMACGVPVAACPNTAVDDLIPRNGGIIRQPDDIDGFVSDIRAVMEDRNQFSIKQDLLRQHAIEKFSLSRWITEMERALVSLI